MTKTECNGIWVYAEQHNGTLESTPFELLAKAQELKAVLHEEITAVVAGSDISALADALIAHGADKVLLLDHANLAAYSARPYQEVLAAAAQKYKPSIFIFPASTQGRDVAPRVMCQLGTGLTADAVDLGFDEDGAFDVRPHLAARCWRTSASRSCVPRWSRCARMYLTRSRPIRRVRAL